MVVAPGFIDMLGQSELTILVNPHLPSKIFQGITTEVTGEGGSAAPLDDAIIAADHVTYQHFSSPPTGARSGSTSRASRSRGWGSTSRSYVGATQVRRMVLGDADRQPSAAELDSMKALVRARDAGRRRRRLDVAAVRAGAVREHRGADRARDGGRGVRRRVRDAHAVGGRRRVRRRSTRRCASAAKRTSRWRSGT